MAQPINFETVKAIVLRLLFLFITLTDTRIRSNGKACQSYLTLYNESPRRSFITGKKCKRKWSNKTHIASFNGKGILSPCNLHITTWLNMHRTLEFEFCKKKKKKKKMNVRRDNIYLGLNYYCS